MTQPTVKSETTTVEKSTTRKVDAPTATERASEDKAAGRQREQPVARPEQDGAPREDPASPA